MKIETMNIHVVPKNFDSELFPQFSLIAYFVEGSSIQAVANLPVGHAPVEEVRVLFVAVEKRFDGRLGEQPYVSLVRKTLFGDRFMEVVHVKQNGIERIELFQVFPVVGCEAVFHWAIFERLVPHSEAQVVAGRRQSEKARVVQYVLETLSRLKGGWVCLVPKTLLSCCFILPVNLVELWVHPVQHCWHQQCPCDKMYQLQFV